MAQRRMFSLQIVDTDAFLEMPQSSQLLYFHLSMRADDDGFVGNPKKILRVCSAGEDDLKVLLAKRFILAFESGVVVIKHWRIHNYIQADRYHETKYLDEKNGLVIKENGSYTECIQDVSRMDTQVRLGKVRLELGKASPQMETPTDPGPIQPKGQQIQMADLFEAFWDEYPVKKARKTAEAKWAKLSPNLASTIIEDVKKRKISDRAWLGGYIPHPTTYLNQERWNDEITPERRRSEAPLPIGTPHIPGKYLNVKVLKVPGKETK